MEMANQQPLFEGHQENGQLENFASRLLEVVFDPTGGARLLDFDFIPEKYTGAISIPFTHNSHYRLLWVFQSGPPKSKSAVQMGMTTQLLNVNIRSPLNL
jgi:hypothetical protein